MPELRSFQREDVEKIKQAGNKALIASSMGSGKTVVSIRALYEKHKSTFPALVVCPASVTENWAEEIQTWAPGIRVVIIDDMESRIPRFRNPYTFYVMSWALLDARLPHLRRLRLRSVIGDEIHYAKNTDTLRSRAFSSLTSQLPHLLLLSGTPVVNNKTELEAIKGYFQQEPLMIRRLLEEVAPDIPPKRRSYLDIKLRDKHQAAYDKANNDFEEWLRTEKEKLVGRGMADYEVEKTLAAEALAKIGYLRRLVGEYKVPAAVDWISRAVRIGEPVVVFVEHQQTMRRLRRSLKKLHLRHVVVQGSTTPKGRQKAVKQFQRGKVPIFIGTKAACVGITLHRARHLLFVERYYTSADEEQAEDRIRRIGQKRPTTMWYLHAVGTIDDRLDEIVRHKRRTVEQTIGSTDIEESEESAVAAIIHTWNQAVYARGSVTDLGRGSPLPPLPKPRCTHALVFSGSRWNERRARRWCKMNGYSPRKTQHLTGRVKFTQLPAHLFVDNQFEVFPVCRDVKIIIGRRLSRKNERITRRALSSTYR